MVTVQSYVTFVQVDVSVPSMVRGRNKVYDYRSLREGV